MHCGTKPWPTFSTSLLYLSFFLLYPWKSALFPLTRLLNKINRLILFFSCGDDMPPLVILMNVFIFCKSRRGMCTTYYCIIRVRQQARHFIKTLVSHVTWLLRHTLDACHSVRCRRHAYEQFRKLKICSRESEIFF